MRGLWLAAAAVACMVMSSSAWAEDDPLRAAARAQQVFLLVEFNSSTCPACDEMRPVVEKVLAGRPDLRFKEIDADLEVELSKNYEVKCVPVYVVIDPEGEVRFSDVGMRTAEELDDILEQAGVGGR